MPSNVSRPAATVDLVVLAPLGDALGVLLQPAAAGRDRWVLPWAPMSRGTLDVQALRVLGTVLKGTPPWIRQVGTFDALQRHPADVALSVAYAVLVTESAASRVTAGLAWRPIDDLPPLPTRQRTMVDAAFALVRDRVAHEPVAFRLLPPAFTLSDLQRTYELLLGHRLHKASFRRALQAAMLVEATEAWRSEGRGRPAQLFRLQSKRRRRLPRGVRFEF